MVDSAGLKRDDKIIIGPHTVFDPDGDGYVTVGELRARYGQIYSKWETGFDAGRHKLPALSAASVDASNLQLMADMFLEEKAGNIIIMGHTHEERSIYYPDEDKSGNIYANCGAWCNKADGPDNPRSGHFVETVTDGGRVEIRLKYWDDKKQKPVDSGNKLIYPRPQDPLGKYI
jgi:hypothetical protein